MADNTQPAPSSQATYAESDLAPITELVKTSQQRSGWSKIAGGISNVVNTVVNATVDVIGISANVLSLSDTGIAGNNLEMEWGQDHSGHGIPQNDNKLLYYNKTAVNNNEDLAERILDKLRNSGLLELAEMAGGIQAFARKRFESTKTLRASAADYNDPLKDIFWQDKLIQVKDFFVQDPIALATIYKYFPKLYELFIVALSASADYGYSEEDALNNQKQIVEEMFKSFGVDKDGKAAFKPIWAAENFITAMQIEETIRKVGWPSGRPPQSPDSFHLRLGAANFYVPPISVSVNTGFKAGSLTGGAIRQKASPKFNAGYKDTTVSLKLFFPNYEEIWGITAQDAAKMNLKSNINIDFSDPKQEIRVDKFLSSLRGLIAAFKYAPILPIKNILIVYLI
jgi:hypothetical protein